MVPRELELGPALEVLARPESNSVVALLAPLEVPAAVSVLLVRGELPAVLAESVALR